MKELEMLVTMCVGYPCQYFLVLLNNISSMLFQKCLLIGANLC